MEIFEAVQNCDVEFIKIYQGDVNIRDKDGNTPLFIALENILNKLKNNENENEFSYRQAKRMGMTREGDPSWSVNMNWSPLQGTIELLIIKGADVNAKNNSGTDPMMFALANKEYLRSFLSFFENINRIKELIESKTDPNKEINSESALMYAAEWGLTEEAKALIAAGANIEIKGAYNETALMRAVRKGKSDAAKILIKAGSNVNVTGKDTSLI
jgi:ankyrin repeat protein